MNKNLLNVIFWGMLAVCLVHTDNAKAERVFDVPCTFTFDEHGEDFDLFTVIDANNDQTNWRHWFDYVAFFSSLYNPADDWFISPAINFDTDYLYSLSYLTWCQLPTDPERMEIKLGQSATVEGMTHTLKPTFDVTWTLDEPDALLQTHFFGVNEAGAYHIGYHAQSDANRFILWVDSMSIEKACLKTAPDSVTAIQATAAERGQLSARLTFIAPATTAGTNEPTTLSAISIYREGQKIATIDNPEAGSQITVDVPAQQGYNTYFIKASNASGEGLPNKVRVYCGVDVPMPVTDAVMTLGEKTATVTWNAPGETGVEGRFVDTSELTFAVMRITTGGQEIIAEGLRQTQYTDADVSLDQEEQSLLYYAVFARSAAGVSTGVSTNNVLLGTPYELPFEETFEDGTIAYDLMGLTTLSGQSGWSVDKAFDQDGTNGYASVSGHAGTDARMFTGKIDLSSAENPLLSFYYKMSGPEDSLLIEVSTDAIHFEVIDTIAYQDKEWQMASCSLADYRDADFVCVGFRGRINVNWHLIGVDHISVKDFLHHDLSAVKLTVPDHIVRGEEAGIVVEIQNVGIDRVAGADYTVSLVQNGKVVDTAGGADIDSYEKATVCLALRADENTPDNNNLFAVINYEADGYTIDNNTDVVIVKADNPELPVATGLQVTATAVGQNVLHWTAPTLTTPEQNVTESFEDYKPFIINNVGNWTMYDIDGGAYTYSPSDENDHAMDYENVGKPMAFQVFNPSLISLSDAVWTPYKGEQYMIAWADYDGQNDDWLITPRLSGKKQTVAFFAKALSRAYEERFEVYCSSSDRMLTSFELTDEQTVNADRWRRFAYQVPEGTQYVAVRCTSKDCFGLMLDNFSFTTAEQTFTGQLQGYNIYADGEKLNAVPVTSTEYALSATDSKTYTVRVVYNYGESADSEALTFGSDGIADVRCAAPDAKWTYDLQGRRLNGQSGKGIVIMKGRKVVR